MSRVEFIEKLDALSEEIRLHEHGGFAHISGQVQIHRIQIAVAIRSQVNGLTVKLLRQGGIFIFRI